MNNRIFAFGAALALTFAVSIPGARAQTAPGQWYLGGEGGWTNLESQHLGGPGFSTVTLPGTIPPVTVPGSAHERWSDGFNVGARGGYQWGPWRFEEEFRYQRNDVDRFSLSPLPTAPSSGRRDAYAIMTNAIYDFNVGWPITPHLGVGVGAVDLHDSIRTNGVGIAESGDWVFGYQGIAGIRYNIDPRLALDLDYRYLGTTTPSFRTSLGTTYRSDYQSHNVVASLSFLFNPPPPPPPTPSAEPAPPPPPAQRQFIVFFDWDKDVITPEGMQVVRQAADAYRSGASVQIQVTGYTDRSGSPNYNQRLSERRANNVAKALTGLGVPQNQMMVSGRGENDNRVPTADGVREPQNRRVEITFP
jgi:OOP family OmpA-OmpF porin